MTELIAIESALKMKPSRCLLKIWKPGIIPGILVQDKDMDLRQAEKIARLLGALRGEIFTRNLYITAGKQMMLDWSIDDEATGITYQALGTDGTAPTATDPGLGTEVTRKLITLRTRSGSTITLSTFFLGSESNYNIAEAGVFGGASASATSDSGIFFGHWLVAYDNSGGSPNDLTVDYQYGF